PFPLFLFPSSLSTLFLTSSLSLFLFPSSLFPLPLFPHSSSPHSVTPRVVDNFEIEFVEGRQVDENISSALKRTAERVEGCDFSLTNGEGQNLLHLAVHSDSE